MAKRNQSDKPITSDQKKFIRKICRKKKKEGQTREEVETYLYEYEQKMIRLKRSNTNNKKDRVWLQEFLNVIFILLLFIVSYNLYN